MLHAPNGASARRMQLELSLGSYPTAWYLLQRLRAAIGPEKSSLEDAIRGLIERSPLPRKSLEKKVRSNELARKALVRELGDQSPRVE
jgi:hypothetical protein